MSVVQARGRARLSCAAVAGSVAIAFAAAATPADAAKGGTPGPNPGTPAAGGAPTQAAPPSRAAHPRSHGESHAGPPAAHPTHPVHPRGGAPGRSGAAPAPHPHPSAPPQAKHQPRPHGNSGTDTHQNNGAAHQKTTICHATGSDTNPYVEITISDRALKAHARHQDGRDVIPAPAGGCPKPAASAASGAASGAAVPAGAVKGFVTAARVRAARIAARGAAQRSAGKRGAQAVLAARQSGVSAGEPARGAAPAAGTVTPAADSADSLPFTGLNVLLVVAIGSAMLLAGFAVRRSRATR